MPNPDISVVVCTRNRAALLRGALASLYDLATEGEFTYEIVVVDSESTDETRQVIVAAARESKHTLRGISEKEPQIVAARNRGVTAAQGRWIAFFDDDQLADWHWLAELFRGAAEKGCRVVGGSVQLALPEGCQRQLHPTVQLLLGETPGADLPQRFGDRLLPGRGNWMIERSVFEEVGRFAATIEGRGEETDLFARIERARIDAWYIPTAIVHHLTPAERLETSYLLKQARIRGRCEAAYKRAVLGPIRFMGVSLARLFRQAAVEYPRWFWTRLVSGSEKTLGRQCELAVTEGFLEGGKPDAPPKRINLPAAPAARPSEAATRRPAPVFILRSGEPTAVMDIPQLAPGAALPKFPSH
ncbi:MAG: glycosyltransferase family 2 protein [Planctomycetaceae bacterium]|nr:glycosyltransferase family 2 protein [Planctomycetaceae bacterium]